MGGQNRHPSYSRNNKEHPNTRLSPFSLIVSDSKGTCNRAPAPVPLLEVRAAGGPGQRQLRRPIFLRAVDHARPFHHKVHEHRVYINHTCRMVAQREELIIAHACDEATRQLSARRRSSATWTLPLSAQQITPAVGCFASLARGNRVK